MLGQIFLTSCLVMMTSCWRIDVSEKNVAAQLSLNVTLDCRNHDNNSPKLTKITKLRILKRNPNNHMVFLAKVERDARKPETSLQNVILTGNASNRSNSFLKLQFPFATDDAIGQFVCEVEGYSSEDDESRHVLKTKPVTITQRDATYQDIVKVILQFKQNEPKHSNDQILFLLLQKIIHLLEVKDKDIEKINEKTVELTEDIKSVDQAIPSPIWPTGIYSIMKPNRGCPYSSTFNWDHSSARFITRPGSSNGDKSSSSSHLRYNTFQHDSSTNRNYVFIRMCSKTNNAVGGPVWPKGSYCIQKYEKNGGCPTGFDKANIEVGKYYDVDSSSYSNYNHPSSYEDSDYINQWYCCRKDGYASNPIDLPSKEPFYLYRYGGTCQKVRAMKEINEWLLSDTKQSRDKYFTGDIHPDGHIKPLKLELCYYKPLH